MAGTATVAFGGDERFLPSSRDRGLSTYAVDRSAAVAQSRLPLVSPDQSHEERVIQRHYAGTVGRHRLTPNAELCRQWHPEVVVRDEADFASAVVAEQVGLGRAVVLVLAAGGLIRPDVVARPVDALRGEVGLSPDPTLAALYAGSWCLKWGQPTPAAARKLAERMVTASRPARSCSRANAAQAISDARRWDNGPSVTGLASRGGLASVGSGDKAADDAQAQNGARSRRHRDGRRRCRLWFFG